MAGMFRRSVVWMRRDLRLIDNTALFYAAQRSESIVCAFVLESEKLRGGSFGAPIVALFFDSLERLRATLRSNGSDLALLDGDPAEQLSGLCERLDAQAVFFNEDYEPGAVARDTKVKAHLESRKIAVEQFTDQVYAAPGEVVQDDGTPYVMFTPYKRRWLKRMEFSRKLPLPSERVIGGRLATAGEIGATRELPLPDEFGYAASDDYPGAGEDVARMLLRGFLDAGGPAGSYGEARNFPALDATSRLSPHLRAGTIGVRTCLGEALAAKLGRSKEGQASIDSWISELVWRDFYTQILAHFPHAARGPFRREFEAIAWREAPAEFERWCQGKTGYPIVDAAMTQLNREGWMHNRLRMIVASFLCKHLLIDYRQGERYFETHLADADLACNNGGWQWASSTGTDAAPYFRIFNPILQSKTYDRDGRFIRKMLPVLKHVPDAYLHEPWTMPADAAHKAGCLIGRDYPEPIVDHALARKRALAAFERVAKGKARPARPVKS